MMRRWWTRLWCLHLNWHKVWLPRLWPAWYECEWECSNCGKRRVYRMDRPPVQFVE